ncbi:MAG TPA: tripartite tricarboxylate transporter substrate binding protein [Burkholderiales bacterium]|nr:tripartite tricarboxylate transporter substrate binding protein [Burkholderiales bacterium]
MKRTSAGGVVGMVCLSVALWSTASCGAGNAYPVRPVRLVVPFAPGGGSDLVGRVLAQKLSASLGQQFIVDNRAGAGGRIGTEIVAKVPPDGYTLLLATSSVMVTAPALYKHLPFDMPKSFAPISLLATTAYALVVHPSVPARTVRELIGLAKSRPGGLTYASSGTGGPAHLSGELFASMTHTPLTHVPYKGSSPGTLAVMAGETDLMFSNILPALPAVKNRRLRALGVTSERRSTILPDVPTLAEAVPGFEVEQLYALLAPAGTQPDVVNRLSAEAAKAMQSADVKTKLLADGSEVRIAGAAALEKLLVTEIAKWGQVIRAAGIKEE